MPVDKAEAGCLVYSSATNKVEFIKTYLTQEYLKATNRKSHQMHIIGSETTTPEKNKLYYRVNRGAVALGLDASDIIYEPTFNDKYNYYEVVASTQETLRQPKPSQLFIDEWVFEYNHGKQIENVLVEYVDNGEEDWLGDDHTVGPFWNEKLELKINPKDNTITIRKIKSEWSKEEVIEICRKAFQHTTYTSIFDFDEWIESNLN